jgi:hypothetical protein
MPKFLPAAAFKYGYRALPNALGTRQKNGRYPAKEKAAGLPPPP